MRFDLGGVVVVVAAASVVLVAHRDWPIDYVRCRLEVAVQIERNRGPLRWAELASATLRSTRRTERAGPARWQCRRDLPG
jgi:hypothetical protein